MKPSTETPSEALSSLSNYLEISVDLMTVTGTTSVGYGQKHNRPLGERTLIEWPYFARKNSEP